MDKRKKIEFIMEWLEKEFPKKEGFLNYSNEFELLTAVILSAQCTDKQVNKVTEEVFKNYNKPEDFANISLSKVEKLFKSIGLYKGKSKNIKKTSEILVEKYNGKLPISLEELLKLPGVGRKTANVVINELTKKPVGIVVDTHINRVSLRLGLTKEKSPIMVEKDLVKWMPKKYWLNFSTLIIMFGRKYCIARSPKCDICSFTDICTYYKNISER